MRSRLGWRPVSIITSTLLAVALIGAPGAVVAQDDTQDEGTLVEVNAATAAAFDEVLLGAQSLGPIVGRMGVPMHSGELEAQEGTGADALFHLLDGDARVLKDAASALSAEDPAEAQRILVDELFPGVQQFAEQAFAMRAALGSEDPELESVRSVTSSLDALDLAVVSFQDSIAAAAAEIQEPQLQAQSGLGGPLNPKLLPSGNVLMAVMFEDRVVEMNPEGEIVWEHSASLPSVAERMANGNTLIASLGEARVVEIDTAGEEVWSYDGPDIFNVQELPNGHLVLTSQADPARIFELDADREEVWSYGGGAPALAWPSAKRLENGNTLVVNNSGPNAEATVTEVAPDGEIVWSFEDAWRAYGVDRLPNGDTLINDQGSGRVIQVAPDGTITWRYGGIVQPGGVAFGPDGRFIIAVFGENRMFELEREVE